MTVDDANRVTPNFDTAENLPVRLEVELPESCVKDALVQIPFRLTNRCEKDLAGVEVGFAEETLAVADGVKAQVAFGESLRPGMCSQSHFPLLIRPRYEGTLPLLFRLVFETGDCGATIAWGFADTRVDPTPSNARPHIGGIHIGDQIHNERAGVIDASGRVQQEFTLNIVGSQSHGAVARQWREIPLRVDATLTETLRVAAVAELPVVGEDTGRTRTLLLRWIDDRGAVNAAVAVGSRVSIGRTAPLADVPLGRLAAALDPGFDDRGVSRTHAIVHLSPDAIRIEALKSAPGVFLDGVLLAPNESRALSPGSALAFGRRVPVTVEGLVDTADLARQSRIEPGRSRLDFAKATAHHTARLAGLRLGLHHERGRGGHAWVVLLHRAAQASLGSRHGNVLTVRAKGVADFHARLVSTPAGLAIVHLGCREGTFVNGQRLESRQPRLLVGGDRIALGDARLEVLAPEDF